MIKWLIQESIYLTRMQLKITSDYITLGHVWCNTLEARINDGE